MNILPFVTILILVISLLISSFFQGHKESSLSKLGLTGVTEAYRLARNSKQEDLLRKVKNLPEEKQKGTKKYFRERITDNSKFNFSPLLKEENPFLEEVLQNFLERIYHCPKGFSKALIESAKANPGFTSFEELSMPQPEFHALWYKMLKGSPNYPDAGEWPPFSHHLILRDEKEVIVIRKASLFLLQAFFGEEIAEAIVAKEKEPDRGKKIQISDKELKEILTEHEFPKEHLVYTTHQHKKKGRKTAHEKDPTTGVSAKIVYSR
ncbi:MAG: hypothetical protein FJZ64_04305 [Chlamydiae bacterium]|nr:hypothetical protein [Chlamydiota bacterium]